MAILRRNAVYITLPVAGVIGFIGYNLENLLSDKYTPYSSKFCHWIALELFSNNLNFVESILENRVERLTNDEVLENAIFVDKLRLKEDVLERNLPPSLQRKS